MPAPSQCPPCPTRMWTWSSGTWARMLTSTPKLLRGSWWWERELVVTGSDLMLLDKRTRERVVHPSLPVPNPACARVEASVFGESGLNHCSCHARCPLWWTHWGVQSGECSTLCPLLFEFSAGKQRLRPQECPVLSGEPFPRPGFLHYLPLDWEPNCWPLLNIEHPLTSCFDWCLNTGYHR